MSSSRWHTAPQQVKPCVQMPYKKLCCFSTFIWFTWSSILPMPRPWPYGTPFVTKITGSQVHLRWLSGWLSGQPETTQSIQLFWDILSLPKWSWVDPRTLGWSWAFMGNRSFKCTLNRNRDCWIWFNNNNKREILLLGAGVTLFTSFRHFSEIQIGTAFARQPSYQYSSHAVERLELSDVTQHHLQVIAGCWSD